MKRHFLLVAAITLASCQRADITTGWTSATGARAIDGDTFKLGANRYRLAYIDAPELPGHCRVGRQCVPGDPYAAKAQLQWMLDHDNLCHALGLDYYHRVLVQCFLRDADHLDFGENLINLGYAQEYHYAPRSR